LNPCPGFEPPDPFPLPFPFPEPTPTTPPDDVDPGAVVVVVPRPGGTTTTGVLGRVVLVVVGTVVVVAVGADVVVVVPEDGLPVPVPVRSMRVAVGAGVTVAALPAALCPDAPVAPVEATRPDDACVAAAGPVGVDAPVPDDGGGTVPLGGLAGGSWTLGTVNGADASALNVGALTRPEVAPKPANTKSAAARALMAAMVWSRPSRALGS
jgi:hypothetical protein